MGANLATDLFLALALPMPLIVVLVAFFAENRIGQRHVRDWAHDAGYKLVRSHRCFFFTGPFVLGILDKRPIFEITVADDSGTHHHGWIRVGSDVLGVWSRTSEFEVRFN